MIADLVDGEAIAIDLNSGIYYSLTGATGAVWQSLLDGATPRSLLAEGSDPAALDRFVGALIEEGLLRTRSGPAEAEQVEAWDGTQLGFERFADMEDLLALDPIHDVDETFGWPKAPGS
ncbi:MAG: hypothetical protein RIE08_15835 [Acidimicrobiales bacterium]